MKKMYLFIASLFISSLAFNQSNISGSFVSDGVTRTYLLYVPAIYNSATPVPLVFNFHGLGSNSSQQEVYGDFRPIADSADFLVVHPQGTVIYSGYTGWNNFGTVASASADLNFVSNLIDTLKAHYNIDLNRVYATGMSNGGFMSYDIACFLSSRFAAIASVSGGMIALHESSCNAQHPTPVMEIHGTSDSTVSYNGTGGIVSSVHIDSLVKYWVTFNNCTTTPVFTALPDINTSDNCTAEHYVYKGGALGSSVELFKIIGGGHSWPGSAYSGSGNTNQDFKASIEIWRFFRQYTLSSLISSTNNIVAPDENLFTLYPNPNNGKFTLKVPDNPAQIQIVNSLGQIIQQTKADNEATINFNLKEKGIYFLQVITAKETIVKKIVIGN